MARSSVIASLAACNMVAAEGNGSAVGAAPAACVAGLGVTTVFVGTGVLI